MISFIVIQKLKHPGNISSREAADEEVQSRTVVTLTARSRVAYDNKQKDITQARQVALALAKAQLRGHVNLLREHVRDIDSTASSIAALDSREYQLKNVRIFSKLEKLKNSAAENIFSVMIRLSLHETDFCQIEKQLIFMS